MKPIAFFHRDMFQSERLVPGESKRILVPLAAKTGIHLLGRQGPYAPAGLEEQSIGYQNHSGLLSSLLALRKAGCRLVVIESPFTADGILCTLFCTVLRMGIIFQPFSQFSRYLMSRRLFGANPDVKVLEKSGAGGSVKGQARSVLMKRITIGLMRACFRSSGRGWLVLSTFEETEIRKLFKGAPERPFVRVPWALSEDVLTQANPDYFSKFPQAAGKLKIVLWSRLDYELKGIDRLLNGIAGDADDEANAYHIFLIGPDYAGGLEKIRKRMEDLHLADRVTVVGPDQYVSGDQSPLATADASVLFSRWDGFPRSLRESLQFNVPVLVSPETHFGDVVEDFACGECVADPDNPASVRDALRRLTQGIKSGKYNHGSFELAKKSLSAEHLASEMEQGLGRIN